jgi:hypothetical protein
MDIIVVKLYSSESGMMTMRPPPLRVVFECHH